MFWKFDQQITSSEVPQPDADVFFGNVWALTGSEVQNSNMQTDISFHQPYQPLEAVKPCTPCIHHVPRFTYRFTARRDERPENMEKLNIGRNRVTAMDWKPERESGSLKQRYIGWWINMERGNTSFADSWWKTAWNVLKLNWHTQHTAQLVLHFIQTPSLNLPWFSPAFGINLPSVFSLLSSELSHKEELMQHNH